MGYFRCGVVAWLLSLLFWRAVVLFCFLFFVVVVLCHLFCVIICYFVCNFVCCYFVCYLCYIVFHCVSCVLYCYCLMLCVVMLLCRWVLCLVVLYFYAVVYFCVSLLFGMCESFVVLRLCCVILALYPSQYLFLFVPRLLVLVMFHSLIGFCSGLKEHYVHCSNSRVYLRC